jgi:hypothetical protein
VSGLTNVGTTTIARSIATGHPPSGLTDYHSTIDWKVFFGGVGDVSLIIFDLGGQTAYQDRFLGHLADFIFNGVHSFVYVLDSIEIKNMPRAKYYLDLSLRRLSQYSPEALIFIFMNKSDLIPKKMKEEVRTTLMNYMSSGMEREIRWYETSIFSKTFLEAIQHVRKASITS